MSRGSRLAFALVLALAEPARAQLQPEGRVDVIGADRLRVHPGLGLVRPLGAYVRVGPVVGVSASRDSTFIGNRWRADLVARVTLDPFAQQRWAVSFGSGVSIRRRTYLLMLAEIEGPVLGGWRPAFHAGVGGGFRGGLLLRRAMTGRR